MTRFGYVMTTYVSLLAVGGLSLVPVTPRLLWNATASTPVGLYAVRPDGPPAVGDLVAIRPPEPLAGFLDEGGYLPHGVPLLKRVAALPGQTVCRTGVTVTIDGAVVATAHRRDRLGRRLPVWSGCLTLRPDELFLLNRHPDSLDGRYFGPIPANTVFGHARPLLTDEAGDGAFQWRAATR
ncbi:S26 family signal peptidase [Azospirillum agricola]|uniref:S26 family signal peptidase n=1 Tax=Azospirillum agricola TaxID=1720247 RepID=UPI000A0F1060|nr:S26 family signal peptidase [Azospirillum agricola]SMH43373.1 conjugative transfer signal peptidase TraF [Azospirillum lipoferum]